MKAIAPLTLHILWHKNFKEGIKYAELFYYHLNRKPQDVFSNDLGIPIHFSIIENSNITAIDGGRYNFNYDDHERVATILFVDSNFVNLQDNAAFDHLIQQANHQMNAQLSQPTQPSKRILFPVGVEEEALGIDLSLSNVQFIRLYEKDKTRQEKYLLTIVVHELLRLINDQICFDEKKKPRSTIRQPIKLFLSHAKIDGLDITKRIRDHIHKDFPLYTFFDANNIPIGHKFDEVLKDEIRQSTVLVINTDQFSARPWCTLELEWAKKYRRPVLALNLLQKGTKRSYPYLGNIPVITSNTDNLSTQLKGYDGDVALSTLLLDDVVFLTLKESLRLRYLEKLTEKLKNEHDLDHKNIVISPHPPELLTLAHLNELGLERYENPAQLPDIFIYPNPPIPKREKELLSLVCEDCENDGEKKNMLYLTPIQLSLMDGEEVRTLDHLKINISISNPGKNRIVNIYVRDMFVELAKQLLSLKTTIVYGGDLNFNTLDGFNFTQILIDLSRTYVSEFDTAEVQKIINYMAFPFYTKMDIKKKAKYSNVIEFKEIKPDEAIGVKEEYADEILANHNEHAFFAKSYCLTKLRKVMCANTDVLIAMGGKTDRFLGRYPGVLEEIYLAMKNQKPVFLIGAFGGAATAVRNALLGIEAPALTLDYHIKKDKKIGDDKEENLDMTKKRNISFYNEHELITDELAINYKELEDFFKSHKSSTHFGLNNGLTTIENKRLFESTDVHEIIQLIISGLSNLSH